MAYKSPARIPKAMVEAGAYGTVKLWITVGPDGSILKIEPAQSLGYGGTQAAIEAAHRCRFQPALRDGHPVTERVLVSWEIHPN
jgi:TonB family protein